MAARRRSSDASSGRLALARSYPAPVPTAAPPVPDELPEQLASQPVGGVSARVGRAGRAIRLGLIAAVVALLAWGSWRSDDDAFPVGPFVMFAFTTPPNGDV